MSRVRASSPAPVLDPEGLILQQTRTAGSVITVGYNKSFKIRGCSQTFLPCFGEEKEDDSVLMASHSPPYEQEIENAKDHPRPSFRTKPAFPAAGARQGSVFTGTLGLLTRTRRRFSDQLPAEVLSLGNTVGRQYDRHREFDSRLRTVALVRLALGTESDRAHHESYTALCLGALLCINSNIEVDALNNSPIRAVRLGLYKIASEVHALCVGGVDILGTDSRSRVLESCAGFFDATHDLDNALSDEALKIHRRADSSSLCQESSRVNWF
jgi:hypothetical protein